MAIKLIGLSAASYAGWEWKKSVFADKKTTIADLSHACKDDLTGFVFIAEEFKALLKAIEKAPPAQISEHYGTKHENLLHLNYLIQTLDLLNVEVPLPFGLSSDQIQQFLSQEAPQALKLWDDLQKLYEKHESTVPFLQQAKVVCILADIDREIQAAFKQATMTSFDSEFSHWLNHQAGQGSYLMVRSTGAEDTAAAANAGGNLSIPYVKPTPEAFFQALADVVCSYFRKSSLQNRLNAGQNPFSDKLQLAVTAQELIGEALGGAVHQEKIPVSGVMFTNLPMYVNQEKFRVMRLNASFGHGEGVVSHHGIMTDTILFLQSDLDPNRLYIFYDHREKNLRLGPVQHAGIVSLEKLANPPQIVRQRLFDKEMCLRLFQLGLLVEQYFKDEASDIEFVVRGKTIYLVQARPLIQAKTDATYLKLPEGSSSPIKMRRQAAVLIPGKSGVVTIEDRRQMIFASSLTDVQETGHFDKHQHKFIILKEEEPTNSHAIVNFSGYGIPCFFVGDQFEEIQQKCASMPESDMLVICPQSGTINQWSKDGVAVEQYINQGFFNHPAALSISLSETVPLAFKGGMPASFPEEVQTLLLQAKTAYTAEVALSILDKIGPFVKELADSRQQLAAALLDVPLAKKTICPLQNVSSELEMKIQEAFARLRLVLEHPLDENRLQFLFNIKILEALLYTPKTHQNALGQYCVVNLAKHFAAAHVQIDYQRGLVKEAHFIEELMYGSHCPTPHLFESWKAFLNDLEVKGDKQTIRELKSVLQAVYQLDIIPSFMVLNYAKVKDVDVLDRASNLISLLPKEQKPLIKSLSQSMDSLKVMRARLKEFEDPASIDAAFAQLTQQLKDFSPLHQHPIAQNLRKENWEKCSPLVQGMIVRALNECIDIYDLSIKSMKKSPHFSEPQKVAMFKKMLLPYFDLLEALATKTLAPDAFPIYSRWPLYAYIRTMRNIFSKLSRVEDPIQLQPSRAFSVSAAMLGSTTDFDRHLPHHLEDFFTLCHQNLSAIASKLMGQAFHKQESGFPIALTAIMEAVEQTRMTKRRALPQLLGIDVGKDSIAVHYNISLRNHSSHLTLKYDVTKETVDMEVKFLGEARLRWQQGKEMVVFFSAALGFASPRIYMNEQELSYTFATESHQALALLQLYEQIARLSMATNAWQYICDDFFKIFSLDQLEASTKVLIESKPFFFESLCKYILAKTSPSTCPILNWLAALEANSDQSLLILAAVFDDVAISCNPSSLALVEQVKAYFATNYRDKNILLEACITSFSSEVRALTIRLYEKQLKAGLSHDSALKSASKALDNYYSKKEGFELLCQIIDAGYGKFAVAIAEESGLKGDFNSALKLFEILTSKGMGFEAAASTAELAIRKNSFSDKRMGVALYTLLFAKGKSYESAERLAKEIMLKDPNLCCELLIKLVALDQGINSALECTKAILPHSKREGEAKQLLLALVKRGHGYEIAEIQASIDIKSTNSWIRRESLELLCLLVKNGRSYNMAEQALLQNLKNEPGFEMSAAKELICALMTRGHGYEIAEIFADSALKSDKQWNRQQGLTVLVNLVKDGRSYALAEQVLLHSLQKDTPFDKEMSLRKLLRVLVAESQGDAIAETFASAALKSHHEKARQVGLEALYILVNKGKSPASATEALVRGLKDSDEGAREAARDLLRALIAHGHSKACEEAETIARAALHGQEWWMRNESLKIFCILVENGKSHASAKQALNQALKDKSLAGCTTELQRLLAGNSCVLF